MVEKEQAVWILFLLTFASGVAAVVGFFVHNPDIASFGVGASKAMVGPLLLALNVGGAPPTKPA